MSSEIANNLRAKKVLVFGLGLLGGGVAAANWLLRQGADVTVTDLKSEQDLAPSLQKLTGKPRLALGGHSEQLIEDTHIIVVNPDVPPANPLIQYAMKLGRPVINEVTLFYDLWPKPLIGVTGTRGKTTTTHWISHLLAAGMRSTIVGNSTERPFLNVLEESGDYDIAVAETPSFQLELFGPDVRPPDIAVVTNIYPDHLNRHGTLKGYAEVKANLFRNQKEGQCVVLNADNPWTEYFISLKPKSYLWLFSKMPALPEGANGVFYKDESLWYQFGGYQQKVLDLKGFVDKHGEHNLENLLAASLVAYLAGSTGGQIKERIPSLPQVPFRQETVFESDKLRIINDTTATSPEGGIAALKRFKGPHTVLITGGTDRDLDFTEWANMLPECIAPENTVFLGGSATRKMIAALGDKAAGIPVFETLQECLAAALERAGKYPKSVVLFSPAAKSFEKFKNEYDRGEQFNARVKKGV